MVLGCFFFFERLKYNFSENYKGKGFLMEKYGIIALCIEQCMHCYFSF